MRLKIILALLITLLAIVSGAAIYGLKRFDAWKAELIEQTLEGYVAATALSAAQAEAAELQRRLGIEARVNERLEQAAETAEATLAELEAEILAYGEENEAPADCLVSPDLLDLLR